jgi:Cof subfamily protein (haloacid dehalogenase superfamily)
MEKHLILIDLDGTLVKRDQSISDYNKAVLNKVRELGHEVIIVTGRAHYRSNWFYETLQLDSVFINRNGGHIHHPLDANFKPILDTIPNSILKSFIESSVFSLSENVYFESKNNIYVLKGDKDYYTSGEFPLVEVYDQADYKKGVEVNMISLYLSSEQANLVGAFFEPITSVYYYVYPLTNGKTILQVHPIQSNKMKSINWLANYYAVPIDRVIAMGDGINDVEMIENAGIGVAMANAIDEVKAVAKYITKESNENSGVGLFLTKYFGLEMPENSEIT